MKFQIRTAVHFPFPTVMVFLASALLSSSVTASNGSSADAHHRERNGDNLLFLSPRVGSMQRGNVAVKLRFTGEIRDPVVTLSLNGNQLDHKLVLQSGSSQFLFTGTIELRDGLRYGSNTLRAALTGSAEINSENKVFQVEEIRFTYSNKVSDPYQNTIIYYDPVSVGFSTQPQGGLGNNWVSILTGTPIDLTQSLQYLPPLTNANGNISAPYADSSWNINCPGFTFQAVIMDRNNPSHQLTATCFNDVSDLEPFAKTNLGRDLDTNDLVLMGTTPGQQVPFSTFDTTEYGGSSYQNSPFGYYTYPQEYVLLGVYGATPGTAHESFSIPPTPMHPASSYSPFLTGTLMVDANSHFNFLSNDDVSFDVHSDASDGASYIDLGTSHYQAPAGINNSWWVMLFDRETLTPINNYPGASLSVPCQTTLTINTCGGVYTSRLDGDSGNSLAGLLSQASSHDLIFLVSQNCALAEAQDLGSGLADALASLGGDIQQYRTAAYAATQSTNTCLYSLVTNNSQAQNPLHSSIALSESVNSGNGQLGSVHGFLARDNHNLYTVAEKDQMVQSSTQSGLVPTVDNTYEMVSSGLRQDWANMDTLGKQLAYADISSQILKRVGETGPGLYDLRYFYTNRQYMQSQGHALNPTSSITQSEWDSAGTDEFSAVWQQINTEVNNLVGLYSYLGDNGVRGHIVNSSSATTQIQSIAHSITNNYTQTSNSNVNANLGNILNLTAGLASLGAVAPGVGPVMGIISGMLWAGSAATSFGPDPASPESVYIQAIDNLELSNFEYAQQLQKAYDGALNNIVSDGTKLTTIGDLTLDSQSGWTFQNNNSGDTLDTKLSQGIASSLWLDILPQNFGIRYYLDGISSNPWDYGWQSGGKYPGCHLIFQGISQLSYGSYLDHIDSKTSQNFYDIYVFANGPKATSADTAVTSDLDSLLITNNVNDNGIYDSLNWPKSWLLTGSNMFMTPFTFGDGSITPTCGPGTDTLNHKGKGQKRTGLRVGRN